ATLGEKWADPTLHPFDVTRLVPWNTDYLKGCDELLDKRKRLTLDQALKAGYDIGFHKGKFSQADRKIEEARFTLEMMPTALAVPNFSACRALFYGFQSSIYSTREALKRSCRRIGHPADQWWKATEDKIVKDEPFIQFLHIDYNRDKHGEASGLLIPSIKKYSYIGPLPDVFSGEGVFKIENRGTVEERRVFFPNPNCEMSIRIDFANQTVAGADVSALPFVEKLTKITEYFERLVREAKAQFAA
ncbi:MAG: hypothetical protein J0626_03520, partial [Rhodospirillaceae bacterium]|nr:hypothetical protein [Rhodospirillaceae bacterium]